MQLDERGRAAVGRHYEAVLRAGEEFFNTHAQALAAACWGMSRKFHRGGRLLIHAPAGALFSDAQHNAVEFIHPVLVGKRALPALAFRERAELELLGREDDIRLEIAVDALRIDAEEFRPPAAPPFVVQEVLETAYHELWELVHVFFEHESLLQQVRGEACITCGDVAVPAAVVSVSAGQALVRTAAGEEEADVSLVQPLKAGDLVLVHAGVAIGRPAPIEEFSRDFYPFMTNQPVDVPTVLADVAHSVQVKWEEVAGLRRRQDKAAIEECLAALRERVSAGATVYTFGNGGSATDSADLAADLRSAGVPAADLAEDPAVTTAIANDIGFEEVFARQLIALARAGDVAVGISTSGRSGNILRGLRQAKQQGLLTVGLAGYGGGEMAAEAAVDHALVTDSTYIPRIQEAQATIYHALVHGLEESE